MSKLKNIKVIFDTNIWISFLIGKKLNFVKDLIVNEHLKVILPDQLILEISTVTKRQKIKKYFSRQKVEELLKFLLAKGEKYDPVPLHHLSRDPKDNFLLDLADMSQADYLVTGDKDLLELNPFKTTFILTPADFETEVKKIINL